MVLAETYLPVPLKPEIWEDIKGYEGVYQMSNLFRFRSLDKEVTCANNNKRVSKGKIMQTKRVNNYNKLEVSEFNKKKTLRVHRIIAEKYCHNHENKKYVNHIDGIKNHFHPLNLEWCTFSENNIHALKTGLRIPAKGEKNSRSKLTERQVKFIKGALQSDAFTIRMIALMTGVRELAIAQIKKNKTWRHVAW